MIPITLSFDVNYDNRNISALTGGSSLDFLTKSMNNYFLPLHDQCKMGVCKVPSSTELVCSRKGPIGLGGGFWPFLTQTKSVHEVLEGTLQIPSALQLVLHVS